MLALTLANLKMMARNRHSTFWALFFPLLLVVVFGLFDLNSVGGADLVVVNQSGTPQAQTLINELSGDLDYFLLIPAGFGEAGSASAVSLVYSSQNPKRNQLVDGLVRTLVAESLTGATGAGNPPEVVSESLQVNSVSYFDFVLLGLVGLGIMTHSIISIAVKISNYRNLSILKRMLVTPLSIWKYFASEIVAHLVLALFQAAIIMGVGILIFGARYHGNVLSLVPIILLGSLIFLNIGFILSAWAKTPSSASGMGNVLALPMMFFAGTFFDTSSLPSFMPYVAQAMPLAPMLSALREVAIGSAPLWDVWPQMAVLTGWVAATSAVAVKVFRFS